jgi:hypothetical protein
MHTKCLFCANTVQLIQVHGHYQCPFCKTNALPCCDGDNCNNLFLQQVTSKIKQPAKQEDMPSHDPDLPLF